MSCRWLGTKPDQRRVMLSTECSMLAPANFTVVREMHTACSMLMGWRTSKALRSYLSKHLSYLLAVCLKACTDREIMERFSFVCSYRARRFGQIVINSSRLPSLGCLLCRGSMLEKHHVFGDETRKRVKCFSQICTILTDRFHAWLSGPCCSRKINLRPGHQARMLLEEDEKLSI